jgi:hypothetical protein
MLLSHRKDKKRRDDKFRVADEVGICDLGKAGSSCDNR